MVKHSERSRDLPLHSSRSDSSSGIDTHMCPADRPPLLKWLVVGESTSVRVAAW
jgi:hypothetical protein